MHAREVATVTEQGSTSWPGVHATGQPCLAFACKGRWLCRSAVYKALHGVAPDIKVECTNREMGGSHVSFQDMLDIMEHSVFCLALAGDSPSTRRLSEIFLAGA